MIRVGQARMIKCHYLDVSSFSRSIEARELDIRVGRRYLPALLFDHAG